VIYAENLLYEAQVRRIQGARPAASSYGKSLQSDGHRRMTQKTSSTKNVQFVGLRLAKNIVAKLGNGL
jgi:hypothetical protein